MYTRPKRWALHFAFDEGRGVFVWSEWALRCVNVTRLRYLSSRIMYAKFKKTTTQVSSVASVSSVYPGSPHLKQSFYASQQMYLIQQHS